MKLSSNCKTLLGCVFLLVALAYAQLAFASAETRFTYLMCTPDLIDFQSGDDDETPDEEEEDPEC